MRIPAFTFVLALVLAVPGIAHGALRIYPADAPLALHEELNSSEERETSPPEEDAPRPRFWTALGEVTAVNGVIWSYDHFALHRDWARISLDSWRENLRSGFIWDSDEFGTNQFAHPYHGSLYYNAARDNHFGYLGSSLFTFLGSLQWELFGETEKPSINDLINTSLGGISLGEVLYRLSSEVLDDRATGFPRFMHEVFGAALAPSRGFNRFVHGDSWRVDTSPDDEPSQSFALVGQLGYLKLANGKAVTEGSDQLFAQLVLMYGDLVYDDIRRPYDAYMVDAQFTTKEHRLVSYAQIQGLLASTPLITTQNSRLVLGALQHFDYTNVQAYEVGGQSFSGSLLYARRLSGEDSLRTALHLKGLVLGGITSEYALVRGRSYDYGPGLDLQLEARYMHQQWEIANAEVGAAWIHTLNGADSNHVVLAGKVQADFPIYRSLGLGVGGMVFQRDSYFRDFGNTTQRITQLRVFLSLH